jgi:hypothetical protein
MMKGEIQRTMKEEIISCIGREAQLARNADNLAVNCEPIVYKIWDIGRLTTL